MLIDTEKICCWTGKKLEKTQAIRTDNLSGYPVVYRSISCSLYHGLCMELLYIIAQGSRYLCSPVRVIKFTYILLM